MKILDGHFIYEGLRKAFFLGLRVKPIVKALDLQSDEKLLDAGCGYGYFLRHCRDFDYTGIDLDEDRINWAKDNIGERAGRKFVTASVCKTDFPSKSFDKALRYGLLHHLSNDQARECIRELSRLVQKRVVFSEPVYSRWHWINNIICRMDRGAYVRDTNRYVELFEPDLEIEKTRYFYARNGLAKYLLISAKPK